MRYRHTRKNTASTSSKEPTKHHVACSPSSDESPTRNIPVQNTIRHGTTKRERSSSTLLMSGSIGEEEAHPKLQTMSGVRDLVSGIIRFHSPGNYLSTSTLLCGHTRCIQPCHGPLRLRAEARPGPDYHGSRVLGPDLRWPCSLEGFS